MNSKSFLDSERKSLDKLKKYQLPHSYKKIGVLISILFFISLFVNAFTINSIYYREIIKYGLLFGLLIISISKDQIEDEYIVNLRMQSYTFAFIAGVILTLLQPFINYGVDTLVQGADAVFKNSSHFEILWILLTIQVFYFHYLKRIFR
jgi:membrane protein CcdC involved in cytochrome C biogenesis